jgi:hypothetical protein
MFATGDPYWNDPSTEKSRTDRVFKGLKENVKNLQSLLFVVIKCWNDNVVLYEYADSGSIPVVTSWLNLDKEPVTTNELNSAEEMLFGCSINITEGERFILKMNQAQLSSRVFELVMDSRGLPAILGTVSGINCRMEYAYVQMKKGVIPEAEYMNIYGRSLKDGTLVSEKIVST